MAKCDIGGGSSKNSILRVSHFLNDSFGLISSLDIFRPHSVHQPTTFIDDLLMIVSKKDCSGYMGFSTSKNLLKVNIRNAKTKFFTLL